MPETANTNLPVKDVIRHLTHELRQPLSALESIAFYLQMTAGGRDAADVRVQFDRLQQMVDSANWVVTDVLHLMQMAPPNPEAVDIPELVEDVLAESWVSEGLEIQQEFADSLPGVWADMEQIRHLLRGVLQFVRRTVEAPRAIRFAGTASGGSFQLRMSVNAAGVVPESLFEALESNKLLTCRHIAEVNGGHFRAAHDEDGWLCLTLHLPAAGEQSNS